MGGQDDVDGKISAAQGSCPAVGGIPLYYLPLVLGREITGRQIKDRQFAHPGCLGGGDGRRGLVIESISSDICFWCSGKNR